MLFKIIVIVLLGFVLFSLGSALYYLMRDTGNSTKSLKALTWRIGLSMGIFVLLLLGTHFGWISPHGV